MDDTRHGKGVSLNSRDILIPEGIIKSEDSIGGELTKKGTKSSIFLQQQNIRFLVSSSEKLNFLKEIPKILCIYQFSELSDFVFRRKCWFFLLLISSIFSC